MFFHLRFNSPARDEIVPHSDGIRNGTSTYSIDRAGMRWRRDVMTWLGMLNWSARPVINRLSWAECLEWEPSYKAPWSELERLEGMYGQGPLIPGYKLIFTVHDLVTPTEITTALDVYRKVSEDDVEWAFMQSQMDSGQPHCSDDSQAWSREWDGWIGYLSDAVDHGGFRVLDPGLT